MRLLQHTLPTVHVVQIVHMRGESGNEAVTTYPPYCPCGSDSAQRGESGNEAVTTYPPYTVHVVQIVHMRGESGNEAVTTWAQYLNEI